jgi:hypothetical protein
MSKRAIRIIAKPGANMALGDDVCKTHSGVSDLRAGLNDLTQLWLARNSRLAARATLQAERLVQLSDAQNICGCTGAPEKHRERKIMVPIPSASKRDDCLAELDWPAMTFWTPGEKP